MSEDIKQQSLSILGKEYLIGCTAEEGRIFALSDYLNKKLEEQRRIGKVAQKRKNCHYNCIKYY